MRGSLASFIDAIKKVTDFIQELVEHKMHSGMKLR